jgi:PadR family transcriptional regulator, regulatory protein PadR
MRSEALKGHLDLFVLATLRRERLHGYALVEALCRQSDGTFDLPQGTVYPTLYRLERAGLLRSRWSPGVGRRRRRVYELTPKGRTMLAERTEEWLDLSAGIASVLRGAS